MSDCRPTTIRKRRLELERAGYLRRTNQRQNRRSDPQLKEQRLTRQAVEKIADQGGEMIRILGRSVQAVDLFRP